MTNNYYSDTAYDSTQKRSLAPFNKNRKLNFAERTIRKHPLLIPPGQCREYLAITSPVNIVEEFQDAGPKEQQEFTDRKLHEYIGWVSSKNTAAVVASFAETFKMIAMSGIFFALPLMLIISVINFSLIPIMVISVFMGVLVGAWQLGNYIVKKGWVKDGNNIIFNRRTGLISLPWEDTIISLPFDEFDAFMSLNTANSAGITMYLRLCHRYSDKNVVAPFGFSRSWEMNAEWEKLQDFMDISKPLPDIPLYDFAREHDPISAEYDKKINRANDFWVNFDIIELKKLHMESVNAAEKFPWGETREQAIKPGWQPSNYSNQEWRKFNKEDKIEFKKIFKLADQGNANSQYDIAQMYEQGKGVTKDYAHAYKWYSIASEKIDEGTYTITALTNKMTPDQINKGQTLAKNWLALYGN